MIEKRRSKRINAHLELNVSSLFKQDNVQIENINEPITVTDVSKHGIGFSTKSILPDGYYFNAVLQLGDEDHTLYCVVKIIRAKKDPKSDIIHYGCEFVGLPSIFMYIFDDLEKSSKQ